MRTILFRAFVTTILLALFATPGWMSRPAVAKPSNIGPQVTGIAVGYGGKYKVGCWTPVTVTIKGGDRDTKGRLIVTVPDSDGVPTRTALDGELEFVPAGSKSIFRGYVKFGRAQGGAKVEFECEDGLRIIREFSSSQVPPAVLASQQLILSIGPDIGVQRAVKLRRRSQSEKIVAGRVENTGQLPDRWWGYEGVDAIVMATSDPALPNALSDDQWTALEQWLKLQGQLVCCVGSQGAALLGEQGRLADIVPGKFDRVARQCHLSALESFVDLPHPIEIQRDQQNRCQLKVSILKEIRGKTERFERVGQDLRPLIVRGSFGFGQVVFVSIDLDQPPISDWQGRDTLVAKLLDWTLGRQREGESSIRTAGSRHAGYEDLIGQLRSALDEFPSVTLIPFWLVAALVVLYAILIGPVDYFVLRIFIRRMEWTWLTFPCTVILFCGLALFLARYFKGNQLRINQVDLVDVDLVSQTLRGASWVHVYSPQTQSYDFTLTPRPLGTENAEPTSNVLLSWHGLPGRGLNGMNSTTTGELFSDPYWIQADRGAQSLRLPSIAGMPIQIWSTKSLTARWWRTANLPLDIRLQISRDERLSGIVGNPTDVTWENCFLFRTPWAYSLGRLAPGETRRIGDDMPRRNLQWRLWRKELRVENEMTTPWKPDDRDVPRIMEIMMFHDAAGGRDYTGLLNRYQNFVDLSNSLATGHAVLVGKSSQRAADLASADGILEDKYDRHWTFYRCVLPVENDPRGTNKGS